MSRLNELSIGLNDIEIPTNAIEPIKSIDGEGSQLLYLKLWPKRNLTIKSNAFQNLGRLLYFYLLDPSPNGRSNKIIKFEK